MRQKLSLSDLPSTHDVVSHIHNEFICWMHELEAEINILNKFHGMRNLLMYQWQLRWPWGRSQWLQIAGQLIQQRLGFLVWQHTGLRSRQGNRCCEQKWLGSSQYQATIVARIWGVTSWECLTRSGLWARITQRYVTVDQHFQWSSVFLNAW